MHWLQTQPTQPISHLFQSKLLADLSQYGLAPNDWRLERTSANRFRIQSKNEVDFAFLGIVDTDILQWKCISLIAI